MSGILSNVLFLNNIPTAPPATLLVPDAILIFSYTIEFGEYITNE
jgi:hypothetical protein